MESGMKPCFTAGTAWRQRKLPPPWPDVEDDAALARLQQIGQQLALVVEHGHPAQVDVGIDVAGAQVLQHQILERPLGAEAAEIDHHRYVRDFARFHGAVHAGPIRGGVVRGLDSHHQVFVLQRARGGGFRIHVGGVLLDFAAAHAVAHDVHEGQHARAGAVDHAVLEVGEVAPAGAAGIDHGGDAGAESEAVRVDAVIAGVGVARAGAGIDVDVNIDEAGGDVKPGSIHCLVRARRGDFAFDGGDFAVAHGDVAHGVDAVLAVDDVAALDEQVELGLRECGAGQHQKSGEEFHGVIVHGHRRDVSRVKWPPSPAAGVTAMV